ncbi:MAG: diguanylate cyclase [Alphaproteobacteria bacterium]
MSMQSHSNKRSAGPRFSHNVIETLEVTSDLAALCRYGTLVKINSTGLRLLGTAAAEGIIGRLFTDFVTEDYVATVRELLVLDVIETTPSPVRLRRLDGSLTEVVLLIHPARELGDGFAVVIARDISHEGRLAKAARESEHRFQLLVEHSMHLICHCRDNDVVYMNRAGLKMLRAPAGQGWKRWPIAEMFHAEYRDILLENISHILAERAILPVRLCCFDGTLIDAQILATPLFSTDTGTSFMLEARDITAHQRAVAALRQMNETLEHKVEERTRELAQEKLFVEGLLESVPNPLWWCDSDGLLLGYNEAFRLWHGLEGNDWIGRCLGELIRTQGGGDDARTDIEALSGTHVVYETNVSRYDIGPRNVIISKTAWHGTDVHNAGVIGVMMDITERKAMEAELRHLATRDGLTGCYNRRHFLSLAGDEFLRSVRYDRPFAVVMIDIDYFKRINDTYGHPVGDEAIRALALACGSQIRPQDMLGRLGGEEFALALPETSLAMAVGLGERLRVAIGRIRVPTASADSVTFTASLGVTGCLGVDRSVEDMLSRADQALYRAKQNGRNQVVSLPFDLADGDGI